MGFRLYNGSYHGLTSPLGRFLQRIANETTELRDLVERWFLSGQLIKWPDVGPDHLNILDVFWFVSILRYAYNLPELCVPHLGLCRRKESV